MICIVVLGMHRSGTSCLAGLLQQCGVELGEVFTANPHNKKGNRENARIMALNNSILAANNYAWNRPGDVTVWTDEHREQRDSIVAELTSRGCHIFGFKDPRTLLTLPFWEEAINPVFIASFRHPLNVAQSLFNRSGMNISTGLNLWYEYNRRLLAIVQDRKVPLVDFDMDDADYVREVRAKIKSLGLGLGGNDAALDFFEPGLRNQVRREADNHELPHKVVQIYDGLKAFHASS